MPLTRRASQGFTLVELTVTLILLSIIGVVAYSKFPSLTGFTLPGYCSAAKSAIRRVQTQAMNDVASPKPYQIVTRPTQIEWHNASLKLNSKPNCSGNNCSVLVKLEDADIRRGIRFSSNSFYFDTMGRYVSAAYETNHTVDIRLSGTEGEQRQIVINPEGYVNGCN